MLNPINIKYFKMIVPEIGKETSMDINAKCIVCGDSIDNPNKKRMHLYTKTSYDGDQVACFNCGYSARPEKFIKDYGSQYYNAYRSEMGYSKIKNLKKTIIRSTNKDNSEVEYINFLSESIKEAETSPECIDYLAKRNLYLNDFNSSCYIATDNVVLDGKTVNLKDFIIIPLVKDSKYYGFYSRNIKTKIFYTYLPDNNKGYKVYNWFNIDKKKPVFVFESIMDQVSTNLKNSISALGSDLSPERLKELNDVIFVMDNDSTGKKKALKYISMGYKAIIYPKEIKEKDCNEMLRTKTKEEITEMLLKNVKGGITGKILGILNN